MSQSNGSATELPASPGGDFVRTGAPVALVGLASVLAVHFWAGLASPAWAVAGWGLLAGIGLAGGAWILRSLGGSGTGFLKALVGTMLVRLCAAAAGAALAVWAGGGASGAFVLGCVGGFLPLQAYEVWFSYRLALRLARDLERSGA